MATKKQPAAQTNEPIPETEKPKRAKKKAPYVIQILVSHSANSPGAPSQHHYADLEAGPFKDTGEAQRYIVDQRTTGADHATMPSVRIVAIKWQGSPKIKKIEQFSL